MNPCQANLYLTQEELESLPYYSASLPDAQDLNHIEPVHITDVVETAVNNEKPKWGWGAILGMLLL